MSGEIKLQGEALILGSGAANPKAEEILRRALEPFVHQVKEVQRIDLGGRTIIALLIALDPNHFLAIESDLVASGEAAGLDVALELL